MEIFDSIRDIQFVNETIEQFNDTIQQGLQLPRNAKNADL